MNEPISVSRAALVRLLDAVLYPNPDDPGDPSPPWGPYGPIGPVIGGALRDLSWVLLNPQPLPPRDIGALQKVLGRFRRTFTANAGSVFHIPKGTLHAWRNVTTKPARTLLFIAPAMFEGFFEEAGVPGSDLSSPPPPSTPEDFQRFLEIGRKYETEYPPVPSW
jgi:hypothetical protein